MCFTKRIFGLVSFFLIFSCKKRIDITPINSAAAGKTKIYESRSGGRKFQKIKNNLPKRANALQASKINPDFDITSVPCNKSLAESVFNNHVNTNCGKSNSQVKSKIAVLQDICKIKKCNKIAKSLKKKPIPFNKKLVSNESMTSKKIIFHPIKNKVCTLKKKCIPSISETNRGAVLFDITNPSFKESANREQCSQLNKSKKNISKRKNIIKKEKLSKSTFLKSKIEDLKTKYKEASITSKIAMLSILGLSTIIVGGILALFPPLVLAGEIIVIAGLGGLVVSNSVLLCISQISKSKTKKILKILAEKHKKSRG